MQKTVDASLSLLYLGVFCECEMTTTNRPDLQGGDCITSDTPKISVKVGNSVLRLENQIAPILLDHPVSRRRWLSCRLQKKKLGQADEREREREEGRLAGRFMHAK